MAAHQAPEILVGDLTPLALELARWGSPDGRGLAWLDPPPPGHLEAGRQLLQQLGLADPAGRLTADGRAAVELGVHPRLGRLLTGALAAGQAAAVVGCALAALLGDRDPFGNDASTADVRERLVSLDRFPRLVAEARRLRNRLGVRAASGRSGRLDLDHVGPLLALAYPDRLAARRSDGSVRYRLAGGGGAALAPNDPLRHEKLLVVADLDGVGGRADGRIRLAAPVDEADLPGEVATVDRVFWDAAAGDVRGRRERRVAGLTLSSSPLAEIPAAPVREALLAGVRAEGWSVLSEPPSLRRWRERVLFCRHVQGEHWPELSEAALLASLESWLLPFLAGCRRRADLARVDLASALHALVPWAQTRELEGLAPAALTVPTGREVALDYADDQPVLAVKLQECFGWTVTPTVAGGAVAVVLHLLSPAGRPLAITADLASFWAGPYHDVRRELRGRYPKHRWPEDPLAAEPGRR